MKPIHRFLECKMTFMQGINVFHISPCKKNRQKKNLKTVYILYPTFWTSCIFKSLSFLISRKFYKKMMWFHKGDVLPEWIREEQMSR